MGGTRDRNISSTLPYFNFLVLRRIFVPKYIVDDAVWRSQLSRQSHVLEVVGGQSQPLQFLIIFQITMIQIPFAMWDKKHCILIWVVSLIGKTADSKSAR